MTPATLIDTEAAVVAVACEWCGDPLSSPYLRRPDGTGLHVACAKNFARATTGPAEH